MSTAKKVWTRLIITGLAACTVAALAAPASGQTLRRDGSKAVPFVANVSKPAGPTAGGPVLRRDGSKAVPFVADPRGERHGPRPPTASTGVMRRWGPRPQSGWSRSEARGWPYAGAWIPAGPRFVGERPQRRD